MSIENRLAAKKRSQKARQRATVKKVVKIVLAVLIPVIIIGAVVGIYLNYQSKKIEYSKYVTADGSIEDVNAKDYLSELADYKNMGIKLSDYEPSEEDIEKELKSLYDAVEKTDTDAATSTSSEAEASKDDSADTAEGDDAKDDSKEENSDDIMDKITDEWVEKNYKDKLGEDYDHTKEGFVKYTTDKLRDSNLAKLRSDISTWLNDNSTVKEYPKKYTKNMIQIYTNEEKEAFEQYATFYAQYNYNTVYDVYGGKDKFKERMESNAKSEVKTTLICLAIYEELGLTTSDADVEKYYTEDQGQDYSKLVDKYGKAYLKLQCKCAQVLDYLEDSVQ